MIAKRITQNKYIKFIIVVLVVLAMGIGSIQTVYGANGWDENSHNRWVACSLCGGSGNRTVSCPKTTSGSCGSCYGRGTTNRCSYKWCNSGILSTSTCSTCGRGEVYPLCSDGSAHTSDDWVYGSITCGTCHGTGTGPWITCVECNGSGIGPPTTCNICGGSGSRVVACSTGSFQYDNAAPTLSLAKTTDANDQGYTGQEVTVTASAGDNLSGIKEYCFDVSSKEDFSRGNIKENKRNELDSTTHDSEIMLKNQ